MSAPLRGLKDDYDDQLAKLGPFNNQNAKSEYAASLKLAADIVEKTIGNDATKQQKLIDAILESNGDFADFILWQLIDLLADRGDGKALVMLLAQRCPDTVGLNVGIERVLIIDHSKLLKDGTIVLCDAWEVSKNNAVKMTIVTSLRRAFEPLGVLGSNDAKFIARVRLWYEENKNKCKRNYVYDPFSREDDSDPPIPRGIFVRGDDSDKQNKKQ